MKIVIALAVIFTVASAIPQGYYNQGGYNQGGYNQGGYNQGGGYNQQGGSQSNEVDANVQYHAHHSDNQYGASGQNYQQGGYQGAGYNSGYGGQGFLGGAAYGRGGYVTGLG